MQGVRPTFAERAAAEQVVAAIAAADKGGLDPPLIDQRAAAPKAHIVALALAIYFGQEFKSEAKAKLAFGVGKGTDVGQGTAWQRILARLFEHSPSAKAAAAACFSPVPKAAVAAKTPRLAAPTSGAAHHTPPTALAGAALAGSDLDWQWWRRGFDAARAEQAEQVREATATALAAAEEKVAAAERMRDQAWAEQQEVEEMLAHVVWEYLVKSDGRRSTAERLAERERARAEQADAACEAYERAFDEFCWEQHSDSESEIDDVLNDEREKLFDARAQAMAKARQPLAQQHIEESPPWQYLFCRDWFDVLRGEAAKMREREDAECELERERALSVLRAPGSAPGGC